MQLYARLRFAPLTSANAQGDHYATYGLATMYWKGTEFMDRDAKQAFFLLVSASKTVAAAKYKLAIIYEHGEPHVGLSRDYAKAYELYNQVKDSFRFAKVKVAQAHTQGRAYAARDPQYAAKLLEEAAVDGSIEAKYRLGCFHRRGTIGAKDSRKAFNYFLQAANGGFAKAQNSLGWCYKRGFGCAKDSTKAFLFFRLSAQKGNSESMYHAGICLLRGQGTPANEKEAFEYFQNSARRGNRLGTHMTGVCHFYGLGTDVNDVKAIACFQQLKDTNAPSAAFLVRILIRQLSAGAQNPTDEMYAQIRDLLHFVWAKRNFSVASLLARSYAFGYFGVAKDEFKAMEIASMAAAKNDFKSMRVLGYFYANGIGTHRDRAESERLFRALEKLGPQFNGDSAAEPNWDEDESLESHLETITQSDDEIDRFEESDDEQVDFEEEPLANRQ